MHSDALHWGPVKATFILGTGHIRQCPCFDAIYHLLGWQSKHTKTDMSYTVVTGGHR